MMGSTVPLMLVALSAALAAPASLYNDYPVSVPEKRAALVLDRLMVALQKALQDGPRYPRPPDGPRADALRFSDDDMSERALAGGERSDEWLGPADLNVVPLRVPATGLQRRGQSGGGAGVRGRVLRCYFNAVTCF